MNIWRNLCHPTILSTVYPEWQWPRNCQWTHGERPTTDRRGLAPSDTLQNRPLSTVSWQPTTYRAEEMCRQRYSLGNACSLPSPSLYGQKLSQPSEWGMGCGTGSSVDRACHWVTIEKSRVRIAALGKVSKLGPSVHHVRGERSLSLPTARANSLSSERIIARASPWNSSL